MITVTFQTDLSGSALRNFDGVAAKVDGLTHEEFYRAAAEMFLSLTSVVVQSDIAARVEVTRKMEARFKV